MDQTIVEIVEYSVFHKEGVMRVWLETGRSSGLLSEEGLAGLYPIMRDHLLPKWRKYVAVDDDQVVGYLAIEGQLVRGLFILPEYQDRGLGYQLLDRAILRKGQLRVRVYSTNTKAKEFYAKYGFVCVEERFDLHAGMTEWIMETLDEPSTGHKESDFCILSTFETRRKLRVHSKHFL